MAWLDDLIAAGGPAKKLAIAMPDLTRNKLAQIIRAAGMADSPGLQDGMTLHVNAREARTVVPILKAMGGAGAHNKVTGGKNFWSSDGNDSYTPSEPDGSVTADSFGGDSYYTEQSPEETNFGGAGSFTGVGTDGPRSADELGELSDSRSENPYSFHRDLNDQYGLTWDELGRSVGRGWDSPFAQGVGMLGSLTGVPGVGAIGRGAAAIGWADRNDDIFSGYMNSFPDVPAAEDDGGAYEGGMLAAGAGSIAGLNGLGPRMGPPGIGIGQIGGSIGSAIGGTMPGIKIGGGKNAFIDFMTLDQRRKMGY